MLCRLRNIKVLDIEYKEAGPFGFNTMDEEL